jgi:hypothetical protein
MTFKRVLAIALCGIAALPAAAAAQEPIPPPGADNYLQPYFFNDEGSAFPGSPLGFTADTAAYTEQADMFAPPASGGPGEPTQCGTSVYGNTVWSVFHSNRWGVMRINTAGPFDAVIGVIPFDSPDNPVPDFDNAFCVDGLSGFEEEVKFRGAPYDGFIVVPNQWYAVQVGGTTQTGTPEGGPVQVKLDFNPPPKLSGDVVLSWTSDGRVAKIKSFVVTAPKGAKVSVKCSSNGCGGNPNSFTVKKTGLTAPIGTVGPVAKAPAGVHMRRSAKPSSATKSVAPASTAGAPVRAAKKFKLLKGRKLKSGSKIEIRITRPGFIGRYFSYKVKKAAVSGKTTLCLHPSSSKPRKRC